MMFGVRECAEALGKSGLKAYGSLEGLWGMWQKNVCLAMFRNSSDGYKTLKVRGSLADAHNAGFVRLLWELLHVLE